MAAKKSPAPKTKKPAKQKTGSVPKENLSEHGSLKLSDVQRLTLNWEGAELRSITSTTKLKRAEYDAYMKKIDPQGLSAKLQAELANLSAAAKIREEALVSSCKAIAESLGMDQSKKWSYDDATGIIHMEDDASSEK